MDPRPEKADTAQTTSPENARGLSSGPDFPTTFDPSCPLSPPPSRVLPSVAVQPPPDSGSQAPYRKR